MVFRKLTIDNIQEVQPFFEMLKSRTCDFTVGGMFMWRDYYRMEYAIENGVFFSRLYDENGNVHYNLPVGEDIPAAIEALVAYEKQASSIVRFCTIPEEYLPAFSQEHMVFEAEEQDSYFDYLYQAEDLISLHGKKFSGQRNQISQFKRANESWHFEDLTAENLGAVRAFFLSAYHAASDATDFEREENQKVLEVLDHLDDYGMVGGVLYAGSEVVGFSLGEIIHDTLFTHIEKADRSVKGAYQMLVNQFAARFADGRVQFINREEDMGDEGLRRAKQAYHPITQLKKYSIEVE